MKSLRDLIADNEDWLVRRILRLAKEHEFTAFTSTLELPWRESICGFSKPIVHVLDHSEDPMEVSSRPAHRHGPIMAFAVEEARLHRQRGVPLGLYIGLTKYYRQAYLDLIADSGLEPCDAARYRLFIDRFFDNAEIATCQEWTEAIGDDEVSKYALKLRLLTNEKNKYLTIFESLEKPVFLVEDEGRVENLNHAALSLVEGTAVPGAGYYGAREPSTLDGPIGALLALGEDGDGVELTLETSDGLREFQARAQRMLDVSEKYLGTVVILSDVTDYKRAERAAEAANRAMSAFLVTMSHEIRTPITGILGIGRLLQDERLDARATRYVAALRGSGEILLDLVNDVLDYSKLEAGHVTVEPVHFVLREMLARVAQLSSAEVERKGLAFDVKVAAGVPQEIVGDRAKIQRILLNLAGNAVKFTSSGKVTLDVALVRDRLRFTVTDTGPGIPREICAGLFAPFVQHFFPGTRQPVGTGLGLAICKRLADALGAEIGVESREGHGSSFWLECPPMPGLAPAAMVDGQDPPPPALPSLDVLVVEDNAVNALVFEGFLERDGHRVVTVESGEDALAELALRRYDIVLMDIRMRGMGGIEAIRRIRSDMGPAIEALPILALTADFAFASEQELLRHGANAVLEKPCSPEDLTRAMARALGADAAALPPAVKEPGGKTPVIDPARFEAHRAAVGPERARRIADAFLAGAPDQTAAARAAGAKGDANALSELAHVLKSSAEILGLRRLGWAAAEVGARAGEAGHDELAGLAASLATEIERGAAALDALAGPVTPGA